MFLSYTRKLTTYYFIHYIYKKKNFVTICVPRRRVCKRRNESTLIVRSQIDDLRPGIKGRSLSVANTHSTTHLPFVPDRPPCGHLFAVDLMPGNVHGASANCAGDSQGLRIALP